MQAITDSKLKVKLVSLNGKSRLAINGSSAGGKRGLEEDRN